jgi:hypothetical protein
MFSQIFWAPGFGYLLLVPLPDEITVLGGMM